MPKQILSTNMDQVSKKKNKKKESLVPSKPHTFPGTQCFAPILVSGHCTVTVLSLCSSVGHFYGRIIGVGCHTRCVRLDKRSLH